MVGQRRKPTARLGCPVTRRETEREEAKGERRRRTRRRMDGDKSRGGHGAKGQSLLAAEFGPCVYRRKRDGGVKFYDDRGGGGEEGEEGGREREREWVCEKEVKCER